MLIILPVICILGFAARDVELTDEENEQPVPTQRVESDKYVLYFAIWWLVFVGLVFILRSDPVVNCMDLLRSRLQGTKVDKVD